MNAQIPLMPIDITQFDLSDMLHGRRYDIQMRALFHHGSVEQIRDMLDFLRPLKSMTGVNPENNDPVFAPTCPKTVASLEALLTIREKEALHNEELMQMVQDHAVHISQKQTEHASTVNQKQGTFMAEMKTLIATLATNPHPPEKTTKESVEETAEKTEETQNIAYADTDAPPVSDNNDPTPVDAVEIQEETKQESDSEEVPPTNR